MLLIPSLSWGLTYKSDGTVLKSSKSNIQLNQNSSYFIDDNFISNELDKLRLNEKEKGFYFKYNGGRIAYVRKCLAINKDIFNAWNNFPKVAFFINSELGNRLSSNSNIPDNKINCNTHYAAYQSLDLILKKLINDVFNIVDNKYGQKELDKLLKHLNDQMSLNDENDNNFQFYTQLIYEINNPQKNFEIQNILNDLDAHDQKEKKSKDEEIFLQKKTSSVTIEEMDIFRQHIYSCLPTNLEVTSLKNLKPIINIIVNEDRTVNKVKLQNKENLSDPSFKTAAEASMNVFNNPNCKILQLPEGKYESWKEITFLFDYSYLYEEEQLRIKIIEDKFYNQLNSLSYNKILSFQQDLNLLGYYNNVIDGVIGKNTIKAIKEWITAKGYEFQFNENYLEEIINESKNLRISIEEKEKNKKIEEDRKLSIFDNSPYNQLKEILTYTKQFIQEYPDEFEIVEIAKKIIDLENILGNADDDKILEAISNFNDFTSSSEKFKKYEAKIMLIKKENKIKKIDNLLAQLRKNIDLLIDIVRKDLNNFYVNKMIETIEISEDIYENYKSIRELNKAIKDIENLLIDIDKYSHQILDLEQQIKQLEEYLVKFISTDKAPKLIALIEKSKNLMNDPTPIQIDTMINEITFFIDIEFLQEKRLKEQEKADREQKLKQEKAKKEQQEKEEKIKQENKKWEKFAKNKLGNKHDLLLEATIARISTTLGMGGSGFSGLGDAWVHLCAFKNFDVYKLSIQGAKKYFSMEDYILDLIKIGESMNIYCS